MPYVAVQDMLTMANPPGLRNYWKADMYPELPDEMIDAIVDATDKPLSESTTIIIQPLGGFVLLFCQPGGSGNQGDQDCHLYSHRLTPPA